MISISRPNSGATRPNGDPDWHYLVRQAQRRLVELGFIDDSRKYVWSVTNAGGVAARGIQSENDLWPIKRAPTKPPVSSHSDYDSLIWGSRRANIATQERLVSEIAAWERQRNASGARIKWMSTTEKARTYPQPAGLKQALTSRRLVGRVDRFV